MGNGLSIDEGSFKKLKTNDKLDILFKNQVTTIELIIGYKFNQRIQGALIALLFASIGVGKLYGFI